LLLLNQALGLDVWDAWSFFKLLDEDGGGSVEIEARWVEKILEDRRV